PKASAAASPSSSPTSSGYCSGVLVRNLSTSSLKSTATPTISAFWAFRCILILLSNGISRRQGAHQVAQKFTISGRPPKLVSLVGLPSLSVSVTSGSVSGICFKFGASPGATTIELVVLGPTAVRFWTV